MTKARTLGNFVSTGNPLSDGTIAAAEVTGLATVATTGAYNDLSGKPSLATVATSGSYNDLSDKPTITTTATNIAGGSNGTIPYQSAEGTTQMLSVGTSGQVLTSAGAAAPTWATPSAGGTITGTASGSIASGSPVIVNTDGTFSAPTVTVGPTSLGTQTSGISNSTAYYSTVFVPTANVYALFYGSASTTYLCGRIGIPSSDGSVTWGSEIVLGSNSGGAHCSAVYTSDGICAVFFSGGGGAAGLIYGVSVTATTMTAGSPASTGRSDNRGGIAWNSTGQIGMVCGKDGSTGWNFACAFTMSGTTVTAGSPVSDSIGYDAMIEYDRNSGYFLIVSRGNGNQGCVQPATTTSSRVVTLYTNTTVYASSPSYAQGYLGVAYVPGPNKVLVAGLRALQSPPWTYTPFVMYITMTGSTPSGTPEFTSFAAGNQHFSLGVDSINGSVGLAYADSTNAYPHVVCFPINGTTVSYGTPVQISTNPGQFGYSGRFPFDPVNKLALLTYGSTGAYSKTLKLASSTLTSSNFIGFSTASYTNGQTVTATIVGGKSTSVSNVSIGVKNYVSGTSLTTTDTGIYAGIGLSSTSLLVKG